MSSRFYVLFIILLLLILRKHSGYKNNSFPFVSNKCFHKITHSGNSTFSSQHTLSSSPWWLHCVPVMWDGIPSGGLQESGVLHWEHWHWLFHELDHEPHGWPRCAEQCDLQESKSSIIWPLPAHLIFLSFWFVADFAAPLVLPGCSSGPGTTPTESLSEEHLATIVSMGFSRDQATKALRATVRIKLSC